MDLAKIQTQFHSALNGLSTSLIVMGQNNVEFVSKEAVCAIATQCFDSLATTFNNIKQQSLDLTQKLAQQTTELTRLLQENTRLRQFIEFQSETIRKDNQAFTLAHQNPKHSHNPLNDLTKTLGNRLLHLTKNTFPCMALGVMAVSLGIIGRSYCDENQTYKKAGYNLLTAAGLVTIIFTSFNARQATQAIGRSLLII